ncbi:pyocin knob domain-containing protein [Bacillus velezensis]|nr:pyocin knob domain-containing protein [Bacillus velezensis]
MAYEEKTDWLPDDPINEDDVNRWEKGIKDAHADLASHKNDMNNPHKTTKAQIGLGNVDNVQQAAKKDFDQHNQDLDRHVTKEERQKWNNGQLSKMTKDNGSAFIDISDGQDFHQTAASQNKTFTFSAAATGVNTPPKPSEGIYLYSSKNNGEAAAFSDDGGFWRKTLKNGIWTEWMPFETAAGAQAKVNEHADKTDLHVTKSDKDKWNAGQLFNLTDNDGNAKTVTETNLDNIKTSGIYYISVQHTENKPAEYGQLIVMQRTRGASPTFVQMFIDTATAGNPIYVRSFSTKGVWSEWSQRETDAGSQAKVDAHANKKDIHVTQADKNMWNGAQLSKITNDNGGYLLTISDDDNFLEKIVKNGRAFGTFYSTGKAANSPSNASTRGMFHFTSLDSEGKGTFGYVIAVDYKNNMFTNYLDLNLGWQGWRRLVTELDIENVPWINVPYKNGAKSGDRPLQYRKVGNTLHLNGHVLTDREVVFGSVPSSCAPAKGVVTMVATSGTTGYSKFIIYSNGDMKLTGIMANIENNVNGYYIDLVLALT